MHRIIVTPTEFGWVGVSSLDGIITRTKVGFGSQVDLLQSFADVDFDLPTSLSDDELGWRAMVERYSRGERVDFGALPIDMSPFTEFQRKVLSACRKITFGSTKRYGELALAVGHPGAARAVGNVMRCNRYPLIVPCHRVVGSSGLVGFSAPAGISLKRRLLDMEARAVSDAHDSGRPLITAAARS